MMERIIFCVKEYSNLIVTGLIFIIFTGLRFGYKIALLIIAATVIYIAIKCDIKNAEGKIMCNKCGKYYPQKKINLVKKTAGNPALRSEILLCKNCQKNIGHLYIISP